MCRPTRCGGEPIGTGPFKLAEFKMNESIKLVKNQDYWKKGLPYLDGIEFTIIPDRSTRMLSFISGKFDMTFPTDVTVPLLKNIKADAPKAICTMRETGVSSNLIVNAEAPPFDNPKIRRALALTLDRKAFIDILAEGQGKPSGIMLPPPDGVWGMPDEMLKDVPGYGDVDKAREEARALMKEAGYGPDKRLKVKVSTRNIATFRDPAVILIDQLKQVYVDGELEVIETGVYYSRVFKKDYAVALNLSGIAVDDPDVALFETYGCGSLRNYNGYCNPEMTKLFEAQSRELDYREAPEDGLGHRPQAAGGDGQADHRLWPRRRLLAAAGQEHDAPHQQHLQQLALRGRLAGRGDSDRPHLAVSPPIQARRGTIQNTICVALPGGAARAFLPRPPQERLVVTMRSMAVLVIVVSLWLPAAAWAQAAGVDWAGHRLRAIPDRADKRPALPGDGQADSAMPCRPARGSTVSGMPRAASRMRSTTITSSRR